MALDRSTAFCVSLLPAPASTGTLPASSSVIATTRFCSSARHGGGLAGGAAGHEHVDVRVDLAAHQPAQRGFVEGPCLA